MSADPKKQPDHELEMARVVSPTGEVDAVWGKMDGEGPNYKSLSWWVSRANGPD
jgi:hypothetical protein